MVAAAERVEETRRWWRRGCKGCPPPSPSVPALPPRPCGGGVGMQRGAGGAPPSLLLPARGRPGCGWAGPPSEPSLPDASLSPQALKVGRVTLACLGEGAGNHSPRGGGAEGGGATEGGAHALRGHAVGDGGPLVLALLPHRALAPRGGGPPRRDDEGRSRFGLRGTSRQRVRENLSAGSSGGGQVPRCEGDSSCGPQEEALLPPLPPAPPRPAPLAWKPRDRPTQRPEVSRCQGVNRRRATTPSPPPPSARPPPGRRRRGGPGARKETTGGTAGAGWRSR